MFETNPGPESFSPAIYFSSHEQILDSFRQYTTDAGLYWSLYYNKVRL
jgi:hypothetical protein